MSIFKNILLAGLISSANISQAAEIQEHYIENANIILNIQSTPSSAIGSGYLLATACSTCQPTRIEVDDSTELYLNGAPSTLKDLGLKIDWRGAVFFTPGPQPIATRLMLQ